MEPIDGCHRVRACLIVVFVLEVASNAAHAAEENRQTSAEEAAEKSTQPFFDTNTLQLQPSYTDVRDGGSAIQVLLRLSVAYKGLWIPGLKLWDVYSIARLEMYGEGLIKPTSPNVAGLQDWNALLLGVKPFQWGAQVGLGVYAVLPTATDSALGTQEFQLGPAFGAMVTHVRHLQIGALVEFFFSTAGAVAGLASAQVQPIIVYHLPKAFYFETNGIMKFDFNQSPHSTVPVNLHFGRGLTKHLVLTAIVEGVTTGSGVGNVTVQVNLNYLGW